MNRILLLFAVFAAVCVRAAEAENIREVDAGFSAVNTPETYDSLISKWHADNLTNTFDTFFQDFIDIESDSTISLNSSTPDSVYAARLKMLLSPVQLPYNDVIKKYLIAYTTTKKDMMCRVIGRSQYYFPMIEQELINQGLPLELRMLPVVESALTPSAISRAGAAGLWQFMYVTGKSYNLEITSFVDQRRDPYESTKAACRYLKDLHRLYKDWTLALAAYNCGPGNVNKALKKAGANASTYWDIYPFLPKETRGYIPSFVAATYAYTFHRHYDMEPHQPPMPLSTDTVMVSKLMHLEQVASTLNTPIDLLRSLNPQYKLDIIPAIEKSYVLVLPQSEITKYIDKELEIKSKDTLYLAKYLSMPKSVLMESAVNTSTTVYRVKSGDTLGAIAKRHGVTVKQLMNWNSLRSTSVLRIGQRIEINK